MNKVEAAREWICSHNDGDVLYVKDAFVSGVDWAIDKVINYLESTDFCQYYNKEFVNEFIRKMEE